MTRPPAAARTEHARIRAERRSAVPASCKTTQQSRIAKQGHEKPVQRENDWRDHTLIPLARLKGWRVYFTQRSDRSPAGFPDCWFVRNGRLLVRELKRDGKEPTAAQTAWLEALRAAGVDAQVWRPADWPTIQAELE